MTVASMKRRAEGEGSSKIQLHVLQWTRQALTGVGQGQDMGNGEACSGLRLTLCNSSN